MSALDKLASGKSFERKGVPPMTSEEVHRLLQIIPGWALVDASIEKEYHFDSYLSGLDFAYSIGKTAEKQDHHPDILIRWRRVKLTLSTHSVKGLSENDFILAAKAELKYRELHPNRD